MRRRYHIAFVSGETAETGCSPRNVHVCVHLIIWTIRMNVCRIRRGLISFLPPNAAPRALHTADNTTFPISSIPRDHPRHGFAFGTLSLTLTGRSPAGGGRVGVAGAHRPRRGVGRPGMCAVAARPSAAGARATPRPGALALCSAHVRSGRSSRRAATSPARHARSGFSRDALRAWAARPG